MAAVLSWLPDRFMTRQSIDARSQKENMAQEAALESTNQRLASAKTESDQPNGLGNHSQPEENVVTLGSQDGEAEEDDEDEDAYEEPGLDDDNEGEEEGGFAKPSPRRRQAPQRGPAQKPHRRKAADDDEDDDDDSDIQAPSSSEEEEQDAPWEADDDEAGDNEEQDGTESNHCLFCGQDENEDPGEEFEDILSCTVCASKAHRQCAREANLFESDDEPAHWRCETCQQESPGLTDNVLTSLHTDRRTSAPKIARDLLPYQRGAPKPGSHSIFNTLIVEDDPMDGSRALRKRKASVEDDEKLDSRKRLRRATSEPKPVQADPQRGAESPRGDLPTEATQGEGARLTTPAAARPSRSRGTRRTERQLVTIVEPRTDDNFTLAFHIASEKLARLDEERRKRKRQEKDKHRRATSHHDMPEVNHYPALQPASFLFQSLFDRDGDETKAKPYGGILSEAEADTTRTFPQAADRKKFEDARQRAEEDWRDKIEAQREAEALRSTTLKSSGPPSKVKCINFAGYEIDTWHAAPYPEEYSRNRVLYICEFCLKYMNSDFVAWRHKLKCPAKHPPGDEIYRDGSISFFEVDGRKNPVYCQNLCLLAKLFLGSKTLYYDVEPFLFYIMTENDDYGCHFVGYFSKEKRPSSQNNVSCILVLPIHQRRGFGNLLIEFSYLLTRVEGKTGSPEKPLSDMGLVTYRSYWRLVMCHQLLDQNESVSIVTLSERTGMTADDIVCALEGLRALVRDPVTKAYALRLDHPYFRRYIDNYESKGYIKLNPDALMWVPYVMGRDNMHYENTAPLHTVAQRDDEDSGDGLESKGVLETKQLNGDESAKGEPDAQNPTDSDVVPFPKIDDAEKPQSPSAKITPNTPFVDNPERSASPIPATRFEVFPPLPGTAGRKRVGRPPRSGRKSTPGGSAVLGYSDTPASAPSSKPITLRRGRSHLAAEVNGDEGQEDGEEEEGEEEEEGADAAGEPDSEASPSASKGGAHDEDVEMADDAA